MSVPGLRVVAAVAVLAVASACSRAPVVDTPAIRLITPATASPYIEVAGLSASTLDALDTPSLTPQEWSSILRVAVGDDTPAVLGEYRREGDTLRFLPAFTLDAGRAYTVRFDASQVPGLRGPATAPVTAEVVRPAGAPAAATTVVSRVFPSGDVVPENLLRMYIEFSAPMARYGGIAAVHLLDDRGKEVEGAFLPLDYEFWSPDRRRFTLFFDPGRVKDGILPNQQMGPALHAGRTYTLVVSREWHDERGQPLAREERHVMRVGRGYETALEPSRWRMTQPRAGSRDPLLVTFPQPLDHGLLMRALGVHAGSDVIPGDVRVEAGETTWSFTPEHPWRAGAYDLLALAILEDAAGNRIGRAFEIENTGSVTQGPDAHDARLPFRIVDASTD